MQSTDAFGGFLRTSKTIVTTTTTTLLPSFLSPSPPPPPQPTMANAMERRLQDVAGSAACARAGATHGTERSRPPQKVAAGEKNSGLQAQTMFNAGRPGVLTEPEPQGSSHGYVAAPSAVAGRAASGRHGR